MMRLLIVFILAMLMTSCHRNGVNRLFTEYKKDDNVIVVTVPGWMVEKGLNLAFEDDEESMIIFKSIVQNVQKLRVLVSSDVNPDRKHKNITHSMDKANYDNYAMFNHPEANFNLWVKEKNNKVKDIFLYVTTEDNVVLLQIKGDLNMDELQKIQLDPINLF
jgi:hypothetical protein